MKKTLPFTREELQTMIDQYPTPFYIYDEQAIRANARAFNEAFADFPAPVPFFLNIHCFFLLHSRML